MGIQYETPEQEREARRVSKRLSQSVLYHTRINMEEVWQSNPCSYTSYGSGGRARHPDDPCGRGGDHPHGQALHACQGQRDWSSGWFFLRSICTIPIWSSLYLHLWLISQVNEALKGDSGPGRTLARAHSCRVREGGGGVS